MISNDVIEKMRCKHCNNFLSFFPIFLCEKQSGAICGRCPVLKTDNMIRDEAYENLAQFLLFPCCHKDNGCTEVLKPADLQEHETSCNFRKFDCPTKHYTQCAWQGATNALEEHFNTTHPGQLIGKDAFKVSFMSSQKENLLLVTDDSLFVVTKEIDSRKNTLWCSVKNIMVDDSQNKFNYRLIIETPDKNYSHKFPMKRTTNGSEENSTKVTEEFIHEQLDDPEEIFARIEIQKVLSTIVQKEEQEVIENYPPIDMEILSELECPVCLEYMLPPIYQCIDGHSICSNCKVKIAQCPLCQKGIQDTQNYVLEKLTARLIYPCKYTKNGCRFTGRTNIIQAHELSCVFGPYECPLHGFETCEWKDNVAEVNSHIENNHPEYILKSERVDFTWSNPTAAKELCYLIRSDTKLFKLHFKYENELFMWSMQYIGPAEKCEGYKFEIDIIDNSKENLRLFVRKQCIPLKSKEKTFEKKGTYAVMNLDQLDSYITNKFSFKVRIYKD